MLEALARPVRKLPLIFLASLGVFGTAYRFSIEVRPLSPLEFIGALLLLIGAVIVYGD